MDKILYLLLAIICIGCTQVSKTEKYQKERDNIINVQENIKEIEIEDVLIGSNPSLNVLDNYLIISDSRSLDKLIHVFNKNNFNYVTGIGYRGEGPDEITNMGFMGIDEAKRVLYVSDHGKQKIFCYNLDSVIVDSLYTPWVKVRMNAKQFPSEYQFINDSLCIGRIIEPIGNSNFKPSVAKWNIETGEIEPMKYEHPGIEKKRIVCAVSKENELYAEFYSHHDLITICNFDGELKYNIYGPNWESGRARKMNYFRRGIFCNDKIFVLYSGEDSFIQDKSGKTKSSLPTKFLVFDLSGDYLKTLETGYRISSFCYDKKNNRFILSLDDMIQFAYLDLDGIV